MSLLDEMRAHYGATADELAALGRSAGASMPVTEGDDILVLAEALTVRCLRAIAALPVEAFRPADLMHVAKISHAVAIAEHARRAAANEMPLVVVPPTRDAVIEACMRAVGPIALA